MAENLIVMKKMLLIATCFCLGIAAHAQEFPVDLSDKVNLNNNNGGAPSFTHHLSDPSYQMAIGAQYSYPFYALSYKIAVSDHSVLQAIASPLAADYGDYKYSFYGIRYIYRFHFFNAPFYGPFTVSYPYVFASVGMLSVSYPVNDAYGLYDHNTNTSNLGYSFGAGYEVIIAKHFGFSAELGYGALTASGASPVNVLTYSGGFHYYFCGGMHSTRKAGTEQESSNPEEKDQSANTDDQTNEEQPIKKTRKHRARTDDDDE